MTSNIEIFNLTRLYNLDAEFILIKNFLADSALLMNNIINNADFQQFFSHTNKPIPRLLDHYGHEYNYCELTHS